MPHSPHQLSSGWFRMHELRDCYNLNFVFGSDKRLHRFKIAIMKVRPTIQRLYALLLLCSFASSAQQKTITGKIIAQESGLPWQGITVFVKGSSITITTTRGGAFSIVVPSSQSVGVAADNRTGEVVAAGCGI